MTILFLVAALTAQSGESPQVSRCLNQAGGVGTAMLDCGKAEIARWDGRLNAAYRTLMARASLRSKARLRTEQRAWLAHHQRETRRLAGDPNTGSGAFMTSQSFELRDLQKRALELESRVARR